LRGYSFVTKSDKPNRDPKKWTLGMKTENIHSSQKNDTDYEIASAVALDEEIHKNERTISNKIFILESPKWTKSIQL
jgi:hypothetical protein